MDNSSVQQSTQPIDQAYNPVVVFGNSRYSFYGFYLHLSQSIVCKRFKSKKKRAEKAAKRAAQKVAAGLPSSTDSRQAKLEGPTTNTSNQKQNTKGSLNAGNGIKDARAGDFNSTASVVVSENSKRLEKKLKLFGHLGKTGSASASTASKEVHPSVLYLAMQFSSYHICGSAERCRTTLKTFQDVITDYQTPEGTTLSRNLNVSLSHQIDHFKTARPLGISMGNAIRWLKQEISNISIDLLDSEAKVYLNEQIDSFIRVRLDYADRVIVENALNNINTGDTVLTCAASQIVIFTLITAHRQGKRFDVIVVDSRPLFEAKSVAKVLSQAGISTRYMLLNGLS